MSEAQATLVDGTRPLAVVDAVAGHGLVGAVAAPADTAEQALGPAVALLPPTEGNSAASASSSAVLVAQPASNDGAVLRPLRVVIDTNVVLDLFLFQDPRLHELAATIAAGQIVWLRTPRMREECRRVLHYPHLQTVAQGKGVHAEEVLRQFDGMSVEVEAAPAAPMRCRDGDDQCFIDLALAQNALLISKDKHVLKLRKRLRKAGITVSPTWVDMLDMLTPVSSTTV